MSKKSEYLALMFAMGMVSQTMPTTSEDVVFSGEIKDHKPRDANKYYFNSLGYYSKNKPMDFQEYGECVFTCVAINDANAKRKFQRWIKERDK